MNQFSDLLDTDTSIHIQLKLKAITGNGLPVVVVKHNNRVLYNDSLTDSIVIVTNNELLLPINLQVEMQNKKYNCYQETAVVIESLCIDNIEFVPNYTHLISYINDHNNTDPTSYLGFNGVWNLDIPLPFYQWLHGVQGQGWLIE